jgi:nucleoside phosphorylase
MIYIQTALKPEAQAFVDYFKLQKTKLDGYSLFENEQLKLIISGMGVKNARLATQTLIDHFDISDADIYCNAGICGASKKYAIGELLACGGVVYEDIAYIFDERLPSITCVSQALFSPKYLLADMESYGFYDAIIHNPAIKKFHILKVVSDHFEPQKVTKEMAKSLLFAKMQEIEKIMDL